MRAISHSEIQAALDCEALHAFRYTGVLSDGSVLKPRAPHVRLREGRAWGIAVYTWHRHGLRVALEALHKALDDDAEGLREQGFYDPAAHEEMDTLLSDCLCDYDRGSERLPVNSAELELRASIPSRGGVRASNRYVFVGLVDGLAWIEGRVWIVEFKLRGKLSSYEQIVRSRQTRWYAWAIERAYPKLGPVAGVIVDERLRAAPKPVAILKSGKPSHDKRQTCTAESYVAACRESGEEPREETLLALRARLWQQRHTVTFRREEIAEAGRQLVSAAQLVRDLDSGGRYPVVNPSPFRCPGCAFKEICGRPYDRDVIDALFTRETPKRLKERT